MQPTRGVVDRQYVSDLESLQLVGVFTVVIIPDIKAGEDPIHAIPHDAGVAVAPRKFPRAARRIVDSR